MSVEKYQPDVSFSFLKLFEISRNMVACPTDGSFYHSYDLSIYCHDGSLYKPAYKVDSSIIYLFYLCCRSKQNTDMENTNLEYRHKLIV